MRFLPVLGRWVRRQIQIPPEGIPSWKSWPIQTAQISTNQKKTGHMNIINQIKRNTSVIRYNIPYGSGRDERDGDDLHIESESVGNHSHDGHSVDG
jgi:hypothetical protein